jgi:hypothetical protein
VLGGPVTQVGSGYCGLDSKVAVIQHSTACNAYDASTDWWRARHQRTLYKKSRTALPGEAGGRWGCAMCTRRPVGGCHLRGKPQCA